MWFRRPVSLPVRHSRTPPRRSFLRRHLSSSHSFHTRIATAGTSRTSRGRTQVTASQPQCESRPPSPRTRRPTSSPPRENPPSPSSLRLEEPWIRLRRTSVSIPNPFPHSGDLPYALSPARLRRRRAPPTSPRSGAPLEPHRAPARAPARRRLSLPAAPSLRAVGASPRRTGPVRLAQQADPRLGAGFGPVGRGLLLFFFFTLFPVLGWADFVAGPGRHPLGLFLFLEDFLKYILIWLGRIHRGPLYLISN